MYFSAGSEEEAHEEGRVICLNIMRGKFVRRKGTSKEQVEKRGINGKGIRRYLVYKLNTERS